MSSPLGGSQPHESAWRHVIGEARFIDDLPEPPGLLHAALLTSPHAHARILNIDAAAARAMPGVAAVLLAADVPGENQVGAIADDEPMIAEAEVHCVGQVVAAVYAESRELAQKAAAAIEADYEPLPAVLDLAQGIAAGSFHGTPHRIVRGDPDGALAAAPLRLRGSTESPGQEHVYLETHSALAIPGEESVHVSSSTQHPSGAQRRVAGCLGWGRNQVVLESPRMGGGFGGKETQGAHWACIAALGAVLTGRPVKLRLDRQQDMRITGRRHPFRCDWKVGFDEQGRLLALEARLHSDAGFASDLSLSIMDRALYHVDNAYHLPDVRLVGKVVRTNRVSNTAFRGFGAPQGMLVIEELMERIAEATGQDPLEVRRRNFYGPAPRDRTPWEAEVGEFRAGRVTDQLADSAELAQRRAATERFNAAHQHVKRGIALVPVKFGISFTASFLNQTGAYVVLYTDGTAQLNHGGTEMGQGLYTKMLQICAHELGIPQAAIRPMNTATDKIPNTSPTAASSGADLNGQAVRDACLTLVERLLPVAAALLDAPVEEVQLAAGSREPGPGGAWAWTAQGDRACSFQQVLGEAYMRRTPLAAAGYYATPGIWYDREAGRGKPFHYYAYGAAVSEVQISGLTGEWRLRRVDILHDVGDSLSPDIDRGQLEGGYIQGLGWLTCEELVFDDQGLLLSHGPSTYKIPAVGEAPLDFRVALLDRAHQPGVIHGSKAVGEPPFCLALSAWLAIRRALRAFGPAELRLPATPEAILTAAEAACKGT